MKDVQRQQFNELLDKQRDLYILMRDHLKAQVNAMQVGDTETLVKLVEEANVFRTRAALLQEEVEPLKKEWELHRDTINAQEREALRIKLDNIKSILAEVIAAMNELHEGMNAEKDETQKKLLELQRAQAVRRGYGQSLKSPTDSRFMDRNE